MKTTAYLSLGSNIGAGAANLHEAIHRLREAGTVTAASGFYETEPVEVERAQPWFVNCALALETSLTPAVLMADLLALEHSMGRRRTEPRGPRLIDIDIVFYGDAVVDTPDLTIPHPAMQHRRFVLAPLAEIAPDFVHPLLKRSVSQILAALPDAGAVRKYEPR